MKYLKEVNFTLKVGVWQVVITVIMKKISMVNCLQEDLQIIMVKGNVLETKGRTSYLSISMINVPPSVKNEFVLNIHMPPTILEIAGIKANSEIHEKSIIPLLKNENKTWCSSFEGRAKPSLRIISEEFRYIETYDDKSLNTIIFKELYDKKNDPPEMDNLIFDKSKQKLLNILNQEIIQHKREILK